MEDIKGKNIRVHIQETASVVNEYVYEIDGEKLLDSMNSSDEKISEEAKDVKSALDSLTNGSSLSEGERLTLNSFCLDNAKLIDHYTSDAEDVEIVDSYLDRNWVEYAELAEEMEKEEVNNDR